MTNMTWNRRIIAYLFMATFFFSLGYLAGSLKKAGFDNATVRAGDNTAHNGSPWASTKITNAKMMVAKERDCAESIKRIHGVAEASVLANNRPEWERNVWTRKQVTSVEVFVNAIDNKPLPAETIDAIGRIVAANFGMTDLKEISIVDVKHSQKYDGNGEEG